MRQKRRGWLLIYWEKTLGMENHFGDVNKMVELGGGRTVPKPFREIKW